MKTQQILRLIVGGGRWWFAMLNGRSPLAGNAADCEVRV
jgi:hypothetical protein